MLRTIIIDDEAHIRDTLRKLLAKHSQKADQQDLALKLKALEANIKR